MEGSPANQPETKDGSGFPGQADHVARAALRGAHRQAEGARHYAEEAEDDAPFFVHVAEAKVDDNEKESSASPAWIKYPTPAPDTATQPGYGALDSGCGSTMLGHATIKN